MSRPKPPVPPLLVFMEYGAAIEFVKNAPKRSKFGVHCATFFPWRVQNPGKSIHVQQGTDGKGVLHISRTRLLAFLNDAIPKHYHDKVHVAIRRQGDWIFLGDTPK